MEPLVLDDAAVLARLDPARAVAAMRAAVLAAETGDLRAPARVTADLGEGGVRFTVGALTDRWWGYRSYDTFGADPGAQVTVLHDRASGGVRALAIGNELGPRRTGAIGGAAVEVLSRPDAATLAVIGTGRQAWTQLWAIAAVRTLREVRVWSRNEDRRRALARRAADELGLPAVAAAGAEPAVDGADIVVLATNASRPVIDTAWLADGVHVTTLGPKVQGSAEFDAGLAERADLLVTDSPAQVAAYDPPFVLAGTGHEDRLVSLGSVLTDADRGWRRPEPAVTVFCSVGLAGTEVALLADLVAGASQDGPGRAGR